MGIAKISAALIVVATFIPTSFSQLVAQQIPATTANPTVSTGRHAHTTINLSDQTSWESNGAKPPRMSQPLNAPMSIWRKWEKANPPATTLKQPNSTIKQFDRSSARPIRETPANVAPNAQAGFANQASKVGSTRDNPSLPSSLTKDTQMRSTNSNRRGALATTVPSMTFSDTPVEARIRGRVEQAQHMGSITDASKRRGSLTAPISSRKRVGGGNSPMPIQSVQSVPVPNPVSLNISDLSKANFANPSKFLKERSLKFANPEKFLTEPPVAAAKTATKPPHSGTSKLVSSSKVSHHFQDDTRAPAPTRAFPKNGGLATTPRGPVNQEYLAVSDVHLPIGMNPFGDIQQYDPNGIIQPSYEVSRATFPTNSYAAFSGQYFQEHVATWSAHNFQHKPLYFEEVNLERYGNELKFQNLMSATNFLVSTAILPYKMGQNPPRSCETTLGHRRPGECVPFQVHKSEPSKRGLFWQGLTVSALAL